MELGTVLKTLLPPSSLTGFSRSRARPTQPAVIEPLSPQPNAIPRMESYTLCSGFLPDDRTISVYLPPCYAAEPTRRFPVFYLHDGQNLFDPRTSYVPGRTWRAGETADRMAEAGEAQPIILVGVANTGLRRMAEYTPTRDFRMGGGEGARYGRLLIEELKPFVDRTYRTLAGPSDTGLAGSSLGGLITLYLGLQYPHIFGKLGVLSPSIWWDHRSILTFVKEALKERLPQIWLDIGTAEGQRHLRDTQLLERMLIQCGWTPGQNLAFNIVEGAVHDEDAWAERFNKVLAFLFPIVA
jgi:predicted alpha/beta superfamily hydrolase